MIQSSETYPNYRGLIFDLDGTIADTLPLCYFAYRIALKAGTGRDYSDAEISSCFGPTEEGIFKRVVGPGWQASFDEYISLYRGHHNDRVGRFPAVEAGIASLKSRGCRLAMVTGKGPVTTAITMEICDLGGLFERVETGSDEGSIKTECIQRVVDEWGFARRDVAYVGDTMSDVAAVKIAGIDMIAAGWAGSSELRPVSTSGATFGFDSGDDFQAWSAGVGGH